MFLGAGIAGNRALGATDDQQNLIPIDPSTLVLDAEKGIRVRPEHLHQSLRELAHIQDHALTQRFPLGVPKQELLQGFWS